MCENGFKNKCSTVINDCKCIRDTEIKQFGLFKGTNRRITARCLKSPVAGCSVWSACVSNSTGGMKLRLVDMEKTLIAIMFLASVNINKYNGINKITFYFFYSWDFIPTTRLVQHGAVLILIGLLCCLSKRGWNELHWLDVDHVFYHCCPALQGSTVP